MDGPAPDLFDLSDPAKLARWLLQAAASWGASAEQTNEALIMARMDALAPLPYYIDGGDFEAQVIGGVDVEIATKIRSEGVTVGVDTREVLSKAVPRAIELWQARNGYQAILELLTLAARVPAAEAIEPALHHLRSGSLQFTVASWGPSIGRAMIELADLALPAQSATLLLEEIEATRVLWATSLGSKVASARAKVEHSRWLEFLDRYYDAYLEHQEWDRIYELRDLVRAAGLERVLLDTYMLMSQASYDIVRYQLTFEDGRVGKLLELLFKPQDVGDGETEAAVELAGETLLEFTADELQVSLSRQLEVLDRAARLRGDESAYRIDERAEKLECLSLGRPRRDRMADLNEILEGLPSDFEPIEFTQEEPGERVQEGTYLFQEIALKHSKRSLRH